MPAHFTIYKFQPSTGNKVVLHEKVPEQLADWLCKMCDIELSSSDRSHGYLIVKEFQVHPLKREAAAPHSRNHTRSDDKAKAS